MHSIPSLYTFQLTNQRRIALRNFGVLIGDDALGGMYIDRKNFEARLMRDAKLDMPLWLPRHLPPTHAPRSAAERLATAKLMRLLVEWFCGYEEWIQNSFGRRYRVGQLVRFKTRNNQVWKWNMHDGWESVLEWLG